VKFVYIVFLSILFNYSVFANDVEKKFISAGLIDIKTMDKTIKVDLVNSDKKKNYFNENFYNGLKKAYLQKEVAKKLSKAQKILKKQHPKLSLYILDAARPRSVSILMYKKMKGTLFEKYVAKPKNGSMHNYGIAVDLTIVDENGKLLDMGISPFYKTKLQIYHAYAKKKLGQKLTKKQKQNRALLKRVMKTAGFYPLSFEWWHFNGLKRKVARRKYKPIK